MPELDFESAMAELEAIDANKDFDLDLYNRRLMLIRFCEKRLDEAEQRVDELNQKECKSYLLSN